MPEEQRNCNRRDVLKTGLVAGLGLPLLWAGIDIEADAQPNSADRDKTGIAPSNFTIVPPMRFENLKVGDIFRAPSRTLTDAHTSAFQAISGDTHPRHYNAVYAKAHGMPAPLVQPLQILALSAPGAGLFTHHVGEVLIGFTDTSCKFLQDCYAGDTLYPSLQITHLRAEAGEGIVSMEIAIHNQRRQLVLSGTQNFRLKLAA